jgi:hypothetical protein
MAEPIKSALFVDYDSIYRSLRASGKEAAERLASRSSAWVEAIESGRLLMAKAGDPVRRRVLIRRCYGDPRLLGKNRLAFIAAGFEVVDCPPLEGRERNSADINMVLDAVDALEHPTGYDEFIVISADTDLTPMLVRLRAHNRATVIYANQATPAGYRAIPDAIVEEALLLRLLSVDDAQVAKQPEAAATEGRPRSAPAFAADRGDIEVLARKVHNATSVPLFSPRTFADLFRVLAQEVAENGYHFQTTAENVAGKLAAAGRNVTRRQVMFVVKGLALKGHVFSTTDTAERLADVFREQVLYLIGNNGLELDSRDQGLLASWIVGRISPATAAEPEPEARPPEEPKTVKKRTGRSQTQAPKAASPKATGLLAGGAPAANGAPRPTPAAPSPSSPPHGRSIEEIKAAVAARAAALRPASAAPQTMQSRPAMPTSRPALTPPAARTTPPVVPHASQAAAPRPATPQAARPVPLPRPPAARPAPPLAKAPPAPPATRLAGKPSEANKEALESSILAAIAQAVDVLVEDSVATPSGRDPTPAPPMTSPTPEPNPEPVASNGGDSSDIGDEIQRIIASYSRARQQGEPH